MRTYQRGDIHYTETKYYQISREGKANFRKIPADGSQKIDEQLMNVLEPYNYNDLQDFSMYYLSGYMAEKYSYTQNDLYGNISGQVNKNMNRLLRDTIKGYKSVHVQNSKVTINRADATYVLLPVWLFTYQHNGKTHIFAMNGQTGKIAGSLPISYRRAATWFGLISGASFIAMLIGGAFL